MRRLLFVIFLFFSGNLVLSQDYIITWKNDTIYCELPGKPGKEGLRPANKYENGHLRFVAFFPNDSVRVLEAGQVKGYHRSKHGKYLLCDGNFVAKKMLWSFGDTTWYFMNRVEDGKYATLYIIYLREGRYIVPYYFINKKGDKNPLFATLIKNKKKLRELLTDEDIKEGMQGFFNSRKNKQYKEAVREYNRLKEEVQSLAQNINEP